VEHTHYYQQDNTQAPIHLV